MKRFLFLIIFVFITQLSGYLWVQTTQSDFESGTLNDVDTRTNPGDVILLKYPGISAYQIQINLYYQIYGVNWYAQTFYIPSGYINKVSFYCSKVGDPGPLIVEIRDRLGTDLPGTTIYATSSRSDITTIGEYEFTFNQFYLPSGYYSIVLHSTGDIDNYYNLYYWNADIYLDGRACSSTNGGAVWTGIGTDIGFKIYNSSADLFIIQPSPSAGKDAYVDQRNPNTNYGNAILISVERRTNRVRRSYIQFDISSLPQNGTLDSAFIYCYQYAQASANNLTIQSRMVTSNWAENTITWNNQPSFTATFSDAITTNSNGWKRWNISSYARGWYDGTNMNNGILLISSPEGGTALTYRKSFYSSDYQPAILGQGLIPYISCYIRAYVDSGYLISQSFDAGEFGETRWAKFYFNATIPSGSEIKFQIATNNDNSTWNFLGPDGTPNTFYTINGENINQIHYGDRYLKFKVYLKRTGLNTPVLHDVSILYFKDYYVDDDGSDLNYGKISSPFKTISKAIEMMRGSDGCIVMDGIYDGNNKITDIHTGSAEFPTFFRNYPGETPLINGSGFDFGFFDSLGESLIISGFKIDSANVGLSLLGVKNVKCENNIIGVPDFGYGFLLQDCSSCSISNNKVFTSSSVPFEGIWVYNSSNVKIFRNDIRNMNDCGLLIEQSSNCILYQNLSVYNMFGVDIISSASCSLYNNTFDGNHDSGIHLNQLTGTIYTVNNNITGSMWGFGWVDGSGYVTSDYNNLWNNSRGNYIYGTGFGVPEGPNDIHSDPLYTSAWYLGAGSPCIDAGVYVGLPYSGLAPDIGAFESAKSRGIRKSSLKSNDVWTDDMRLTNEKNSSYLSWNNSNPLFIKDSIIGIFFYDNRLGNYNIYLLKSYENGESWNEEIPITTDNLNNIFPSISNKGDTIFLVYIKEVNGVYHLIFRISYDLGENWSEEKILASLNNSSSPSIAVSGDNVHIVYSDNDEIFYIRSTDGGLNFETPVQITYSPFESYSPSISCKNDTIHITWFDRRDGNYEVYYKNSFDNGSNWSVDKRITFDDSSSIYPFVLSENNYVYIFYQDNRSGDFNIYYRISEDYGSNFGDEKRLTEEHSYYPRGDINNNYIHIVYREGNDIFYKFSIDNGNTFNEKIQVSSSIGVSEYPFCISKNDTIFITWFDERDGNPEIYFKRNMIDTTGTYISEEEYKDHKLFQNKPNPFSEKTYIEFIVGEGNNKSVSLCIYDILGNLVNVLKNEKLKSGKYYILWNGKDRNGKLLPNGVYFYELKIGDFVQRKKMVIIR